MPWARSFCPFRAYGEKLAKVQLSILSFALVSPPHQFLSQCREVTLVALLHNLDAMRSLSDDKAGFLCHTLTTSIDGYQIVVAATLDMISPC